jgi:hypothetical protein
MEHRHEDVYENKIAGLCGALLFALGGGIIYFLLYQLGYISSISGLVGAVLAMKGYALFSKKESMFGVITSAVLALLVLAAAWYLCLAKDVYEAFQEWFAAGEIDYTVSFGEAVQGAHLFLEDPEISRSYLGDLGMSLLFAVIGCFGNVWTALKNQKAQKAQQGAPIQAEAKESPYSAEEPNPFAQDQEEKNPFAAQDETKE